MKRFTIIMPIILLHFLVGFELNSQVLRCPVTNKHYLNDQQGGMKYYLYQMNNYPQDCTSISVTIMREWMLDLDVSKLLIKRNEFKITNISEECMSSQTKSILFKQGSNTYFLSQKNPNSIDQPIKNDSAFEIGLKCGLVYSMIKDIDDIYYPDKIINHYNPFFSLYLERRIGDISFEGNISYKRLGFEVSRKEGLPKYDVDADFHYAMVGFITNYYIPLNSLHPRIFMGINYSFLISASGSYSTYFSSFEVHEDIALHKRKKVAIPFVLFGTGINLCQNDHLALEVAGEIGIISPVKERKNLEGDYLFLPNKFKFVNIYLIVKL